MELIGNESESNLKEIETDLKAIQRRFKKQWEAKGKRLKITVTYHGKRKIYFQLLTNLAAYGRLLRLMAFYITEPALQWRPGRLEMALAMEIREIYFRLFKYIWQNRAVY